MFLNDKMSNNPLLKRLDAAEGGTRTMVLKEKNRPPESDFDSKLSLD